MNSMTILIFALLFNLNGLLSQNLKNQKIALVVGIANYEHVGQLKNTINDANDMSEALKKLGFVVYKILDPSIKELNRAIDSFGIKMATANVCVFYYSGHGAEYEGENYLFPKNSNPVTPTDLPYEAVSVGKVLGKIDFSKINTSIVLLDACRNNPFTKRWSKDLNKYQGLASISPPNGTFIGFAASPGKTASDGAKRNGTYTEAILKYINEESYSIDKVFNLVNKEVRIQSNGAQIPYKSSSLEDDFYFIHEYSIASKQELKNRVNSNNDSQNVSNGSWADLEYPVVLAVQQKNKFPFPPIVKGYSTASFSPYGDIRIKKIKYLKGENILFDVDLKSDIWDKSTPLVIEIVKWTDSKNMNQVYYTQFSSLVVRSIVSFVPPIEEGTYEIRIGFYFINELNTEYPPFYSKRFTISIQ